MKKKAIKIATSTAIAASAFVAAAPTQAASNVDAQVKAAVDAGTVLKWAISIEGTGDGQTRPWDAYNDAKAKLAKAEAAVAGLSAADKAVASAKLEATKLQISRAMAYIDAITAGENITTARLALEAAISSGNLDAVEKAYHGMTAQARKQNKLLDRVYGQSTRDLIRTNYKVAAEKVQASVLYDVTVKMALDKAQGFVTGNDLDKAEAYLAEAKKYLEKVSATFKTQLSTKIDQVEATVTPRVVGVSAINAKELQITFNKAITKASVIDSSDDLIANIITLNSTDARSLSDNAYLSADGKTLTLVATTTWNGSYAFEVAQNKVEAGATKVAEYKAFVSASDTTRPTFAGVSYEPSGLAKFSFSEPLDETAALIASKLVVSGGTTVAITDADITLAADKKSFTVSLPSTMTKDASYTFTFTGLKDFAGNLLSPNPLSATVVKADRDTVKPTVTNVVALDTGKLQVTFSEKIRANTAVVTVGAGNYSTYTLDATGTIATFTGVTNLTAGVQSVQISSAADLAGLVLDTITRVVQVSADTTAPAYVNHTVETVGSERFLVVNYNEEITANQAVSVTGTYVNSNSITQAITPITGADITRGADKKSVRIKLPATAGTYTVLLPVALAEDTSAATNDSAARTVSFTLGTAVDATKPVTSGYAQVGNKVTVTFDRDVTAATALNVGNYSIDGVSSPFESAIFKGNARTVELTLRHDAITTNGVRNYTVSNVATSAGSVMVSETSTYNFKENVRPTVLGAKIISATEIEVTLSEALDSATVGTDFDVFQGTSTTALTDVETISGTNKVLITLGTPLVSLNGLTLKAASTIDLTDVNGNTVNFVGPITVTSN
ncbi:hypothetical protein IMZ08_03395 [Bacillus luteolus]|uniref:SbsC C-terminal domain-containing protein n=1 Tax=Litchfieldia luteola TaxID=682179 RepID=A0ABR9QF32_9BACI|nr:Ig-like domain-containing protein [Cytobacillus luteolus]MBE4907102.1 hypothetical protein [Cytobacillus luteolus]MBP1943429.1 regulator of extracellular matrix RemA (YlzA/DUF370 family) [Cytobacillus luteolus]